MQWRKGFIHVPQYEYAGTNQHGDRYKRISTKKISTSRLSTIVGEAEDIQTLIILGSQLDVPVQYDFDVEPQVAYIEVAGKEAL